MIRLTYYPNPTVGLGLRWLYIDIIIIFIQFQRQAIYRRKVRNDLR